MAGSAAYGGRPRAGGIEVSCRQYGAPLSTVAERREDSANRRELKRQVQNGQLSSITRKTIDKIEESLGISGGNLAYAGYPYDPFVLDTVKH